MNDNSTQTTNTTTTTTSTSAAALNARRVLYVGGLAEGATEALIQAACVPFGPLVGVTLPMDYVQGTHKGFCFVEFRDPEDADEALYNLDCAEFLGKVVRVSLAQANQLHKLTSSSSNRSEAVWKSDEWFQQQHAAADATTTTATEQAAQEAVVATLGE